MKLLHSYIVIILYTISDFIIFYNNNNNESQGGGQQIRFQPGIGKLLAVANGNFINLLDIQTWRLQNRLKVCFKCIYMIVN